MSEELVNLETVLEAVPQVQNFSLVSPGLAFLLNSRDEIPGHVEGTVLVNQLGEFGLCQKNLDGSILLCFGLRSEVSGEVFPKNYIIKDGDYNAIKADPATFIQGILNMESEQQTTNNEKAVFEDDLPPEVLGHSDQTE